MAEAPVILKINCETVASLTSKPEIWKAAPFLKPMELPCVRMHAQIKRAGCWGCKGKKAKEELGRVFCKVSKSLFELTAKAKAEKKDLKGLQQIFSNASGKWVAGIETSVPFDGNYVKVMF